jgi:hypothetical protein
MLRTLFYIFFIVISNVLCARIINYDFKDLEKNKEIILKSLYTNSDVSRNTRPPFFQEGYLCLLNGGRDNHQNVVALFPDIIDDNSATEHYSFNLNISRGGEGVAFALLNREHYEITTESEIEQYDSLFNLLSPKQPAIHGKSRLKLSKENIHWDEPNFKKSFAIGIDIRNQQSSHWFDEFGNYYGREEREISLHYDDTEIFKILSPIEFRTSLNEDETFQWDIFIDYINAGAEITLRIENEIIIDHYFIPEMFQYKKQPIFGGSTSEITTNAIITEFSYDTSSKKPNFSLVDSIEIIKNAGFHAQQQQNYNEVLFGSINKKSDKVILTLDLTGLEGGVSGWDVSGRIYIINEKEESFELLRFITPYHRGYIWKVDVTDFLPLLEGKKTIYTQVSTWEPLMENPSEQLGWNINAKLDFYYGKEKLKPFAIQNLWTGNLEYGDPNNPMKTHLPNFNITIPKGAKSAKLRVTTTGHGMHPNSQNAGEFYPAERWLHINGDVYYNKLWNEDCYLNPCRPQGGTWKFDRAGWAPGSVVKAWEINLDKYINDKSIEFEYQPDDYINYGKEEADWNAFHYFSSEVIFYN